MYINQKTTERTETCIIYNDNFCEMWSINETQTIGGINALYFIFKFGIGILIIVALINFRKKKYA
jgi:hypothetical protein